MSTSEADSPTNKRMFNPTISQPNPSSQLTAFHAMNIRSDISNKLSKAVFDLRLKHKPRMIRLMRVQYVQTLDIREQFWRLGVPVDVTFMFYNPSTPMQPKAGKLKSAFPKMKICLCGNDWHAKHMIKQHERLSSCSQQKLLNGKADDFIFEVICYCDVLGCYLDVRRCDGLPYPLMPLNNHACRVICRTAHTQTQHTAIPGHRNSVGFHARI